MHRSPATEPVPAEADSICIGCGICCDGTLFAHVPLALSDKRDVLETAGSVVTTIGIHPVMELGCGAFDGGCCTIYADRPAMCGAFTCALHRRHAAGEISTADARAAIVETIALRDTVRPAVESFLGVEAPSRGTVVLFNQLAEAIAAAPDPDAVERSNQMLLVYVSGLQLRLHQMFHNTASSAAEVDQPPSAASDSSSVSAVSLMKFSK